MTVPSFLSIFRKFNDFMMCWYTKSKIQTTKARPRKVRGLKRNTKLKETKRKQEHWGRRRKRVTGNRHTHRWLKFCWSYQKMFFSDWRNSENVRWVSWRVDVSWRWNTADERKQCDDGEKLTKVKLFSVCVCVWNYLIKCKTASFLASMLLRHLDMMNMKETNCWGWIYSFCLVSTRLALWLGLGTNTTRSGLEKHRGLASNTVFCRQDLGWRQSDFPSFLPSTFWCEMWLITRRERDIPHSCIMSAGGSNQLPTKNQTDAQNVNRHFPFIPLSLWRLFCILASHSVFRSILFIMFQEETLRIVQVWRQSVLSHPAGLDNIYITSDHRPSASSVHWETLMKAGHFQTISHFSS